MRMVVPVPTVDSRSMRAPCRTAICLTMALEPHDRVLAGTGPEVSYTQWLDFTPAKVPGLAAVQYVDCKTVAGQAAHVEAGGWWTRSGSGAHSLSN